MHTDDIRILTHYGGIAPSRNSKPLAASSSWASVDVATRRLAVAQEDTFSETLYRWAVLESICINDGSRDEYQTSPEAVSGRRGSEQAASGLLTKLPLPRPTKFIRHP